MSYEAPTKRSRCRRTRWAAKMASRTTVEAKVGRTPVMTETPEIQTETLTQRLARGPLEPQVALNIFKRLLKTLALLHWSGAVHGSLTPLS